MNACESHPQRQKILDAILNGDSARQIATWMHPSVHHSTINRFRRKILATAVTGLGAKHSKHSPIQDVAIAAGIANGPKDHPLTPDSALRKLLRAKIDERMTRRNTWIANAEQRPILDKEGAIVGNMMDHKALASHDRNEAGDLQFVAELEHLMQAETSTVTVNLAILAPSQQASSSAADAVVDVSAIRR